MVLPRPTALRASSITRYARPARSIRSAELRPWQQMLQRRTYASGHSSGGETLKSDLPWMMGAAAATAGGLYLVLTQDLGGHGDEHGHDEHHGKEDEGHEEEAPAEEEQEEESKDESKDDKQESEEDKDASKEEAKKDPVPEVASQASKDPADSDKPHPQKQPKSQNETSGKQAGMSNDDTRHPVNPGDRDDKSSKGEGVAETAKLKGTVSSERPQADNKEERGKATQDKSK